MLLWPSSPWDAYLLSEDWELSNVDYGELICTGSITCSWRPGDFGLSKDTCSRFTFHLQSSWLGSQLGSGVSQGLKGSQGHEGCEDLSFALPLSPFWTCWAPAWLFFFSHLYLHGGNTWILLKSEKDWIRCSSASSVLTKASFFQYESKQELSQVSKWWHVSC